MKRIDKRYLIKIMKNIALVFIVFFMLFVIYFNMTMSQALEENILENLEKDAIIISKEVDNYFIHYGEIVNQMLLNESIIQYVHKVESKDQMALHPQYNEVSDFLKRVQESDDQLSLVWIGINKADYLLTSDRNWSATSEFDIESRPWYEEMVGSSEKIVFTTPYRDYATGEVIVSVVAPIYQKGKVIGNAGIDIRIEDINTYVSSYKIGKDGYAVLVSDKQTIVTHPDETLIMNPDILKEKNVVFENIQKMLSDEDGVFEYEYEDEKKYLAYATVDSNNWRVGSTVSKSETREQVNMFMIMSAIVFGLSLMIIIVLQLILKLTNNYHDLNQIYTELKTKDEALESSNLEMEAAYQQLSASEEELRAQYEEIQSYSQKLEALKRRYELATEFTESLVWELDVSNETVDFLNGALPDIEKDASNIWMMIDKYLIETDKSILRKEFDDYRNGIKEEVYCQVRVRTVEDSIKWLLIQGRSFYNRDERRNFINGIMLDITNIKEQEEHITKLAYIDPLTEIPNRRSFLERLYQGVQENDKGAIILLDLDNFKEINDTLGHVYGDQVLKEVAHTILEISTEKIFVSRFGGDEFLIQISDTDDQEEIEKYVGDIAELFNRKMIIGEEEIYISMSMGVTLYPKDSSDVDKLIMNADLAMYSVKNSGKNNYIFYDDEMSEQIERKSQIDKILRTAIANDKFSLVYQPQVSSISKEVVGLEALLRLKDSDISPGSFIPVAEETGQIIEIGRWVTESIIEQLSIWRDQGVKIKPVAINFSPKQLNDAGYVEFLSHTLEKYNIPPKYIDIEITESILLENELETMSYLNRLKDLGISMALDDFGTGFSSISYLTFLPIDKIKLDKSLSDKFLEKDNLTIIENIISLAHSLNLKVVAEGIETEKQFHDMKAAKCDTIQGYYISKPIDVDDTTRVLSD